MDADDHIVLIRVRVKPGSARPGVGGTYFITGGLGPALVVRVAERAVDGKATRAVLRTVAAAFGLPRSAVQVHSGVTARTKTLRITGEAAAIRARLAGLLRPERAP
ncbi:MAG TPA: DUF167 domain-containing protein [Dermatophilaceae bacterium]|nr:DUF167 domain-containing protein [Dermatophilaceae bacterium]